MVRNTSCISNAMLLNLLPSSIKFHSMQKSIWKSKELSAAQNPKNVFPALVCLRVKRHLKGRRGIFEKLFGHWCRKLGSLMRKCAQVVRCQIRSCAKQWTFTTLAVYYAQLSTFTTLHWQCITPHVIVVLFWAVEIEDQRGRHCALPNVKRQYVMIQFKERVTKQFIDFTELDQNQHY